MAAGLAGGVAGNSLDAAGTGAVGGKVAVENNALAKHDESEEEFEKEEAKLIGGFPGKEEPNNTVDIVPTGISGALEMGAAAGLGKSGEKETASGQSSTIVPGGGLAAHEAAGGHLIERHIGQIEADLLNRVSTGNVKSASPFTDRTTAEAVKSKAIDNNQLKIQDYLSGSQRGYLELDYHSSSAIGISVSRESTNAVSVTNARIIIGRDPSMPDGYKIITGYPTP